MGKQSRDLVWCAKLQNPKIEKLHLDFLSLLAAVDIVDVEEEEYAIIIGE
jgi:hypothetical protein